MIDLKPDSDEMFGHLHMLFANGLVLDDALIEIAWTTVDANGKHTLNRAKLFRVDQIEAAAGEAYLQNMRGSNVYVGVCVRKPGTPLNKRASDHDVLATTHFWCDFDAPGTSENAPNLWGDWKPLFRVFTGRHPHERSHAYFFLTSACHDHDLMRDTMHGMASELNGDPTVCNPSRVMRLAGTVAWPAKEGRIPELVTLELVEDKLIAYSPDELHQRYGLVEEEPVRAPSVPIEQPLPARNTNQHGMHIYAQSLGIGAAVLEDGREKYMRNTVAACLRAFIGETGAAPSAQQLFDVAWPQYAEHADWRRLPARGPDEMMKKCIYAIERFARGDIRGMRTVEEAIKTHRARAANANGNETKDQRDAAGDAAQADAAGKNGSLPEAVQLQDFYAYMPEHKYIYIPTGQIWPGSSVNGRIPKIGNVLASSWLDQNRPVEQMTWAPGQPTEMKDRLIAEGGWFNRPGCRVFNLYHSPIIEPRAGDAGPWLQHVERLYGADAQHIILWCAHRVQRPAEKINHALVLGGKQGVGKDTLLEPVKQAVGPWNFIEVSPQQILGRFNGFLKSVVLRVSEARDLGEFDRFAFYDHMKALTAAPPDVLRVDEKNRQEYSIPNVTGVVITTNHKSDGIYLPADDRRHFVAWSELDKTAFTSEYWSILWQWYANGGVQIVGDYLLSLDLAAFNPKAPPPQTEAFYEIVNSSRAPEDAELADAIEWLGSPNAVTIADIISVPDQFPLREFLTDRRNARRIPHRMEACGYVPVRNPNVKDGLWKVSRRRQVIYAKDTLTPLERAVAARHLV